jgi:hypothetical protein
VSVNITEHLHKHEDAPEARDIKGVSFDTSRSIKDEGEVSPIDISYTISMFHFLDATYNFVAQNELMTGFQDLESTDSKYLEEVQEGFLTSH